MKKDEAKQGILSAFREWAAANDITLPASGTDGFAFFGYVNSARPDLLKFRAAGDKWQTIHGWLRQANLSRD